MHTHAVHGDEEYTYRDLHMEVLQSCKERPNLICICINKGGGGEVNQKSFDSYGSSDREKTHNPTYWQFRVCCKLQGVLLTQVNTTYCVCTTSTIYKDLHENHNN